MLTLFQLCMAGLWGRALVLCINQKDALELLHPLAYLMMFQTLLCRLFWRPSLDIDLTKSCHHQPPRVGISRAHGLPRVVSIALCRQSQPRSRSDCQGDSLRSVTSFSGHSAQLRPYLYCRLACVVVVAQALPPKSPVPLMLPQQPAHKVCQMHGCRHKHTAWCEDQSVSCCSCLIQV